MSRSFPNQLLERLGLQVPIIQAPMAGVSSPAMAAAVANSGGLGSLGVGAMQAEQQVGRALPAAWCVISADGVRPTRCGERRGCSTVLRQT